MIEAVMGEELEKAPEGEGQREMGLLIREKELEFSVSTTLV